MSIHYAVYDCPLRVVVEAAQSAIGYTYPRIFVEVALDKEYLNCDLYLGTIFKMKAEDFVDWWEDATPKATKELCAEMHFNEEAFREFLRNFIDKDKCAPQALQY